MNPSLRHEICQECLSQEEKNEKIKKSIEFLIIAQYKMKSLAQRFYQCEC